MFEHDWVRKEGLNGFGKYAGKRWWMVLDDGCLRKSLYLRFPLPPVVLTLTSRIYPSNGWATPFLSKSDPSLGDYPLFTF